jgi:LAO/AO transport system kinase
VSISTILSVYIRSIATRGSLGGLSAKIIEITDIMRSANFDIIIVETVGVGQSEIEIVGLADVTVLVLVPEAGDEIQQLKSGVMEIADVFAINKADRPGADIYLKNLYTLLHSASPDKKQPQVVKTIAIKNEGHQGIIGSMPCSC